MAPVIMGNADRPELGEELDEQLLPDRPRDRRPLRARDVPGRQPRRPRLASGPRAWSCSARGDVIAPESVGRLRARAAARQRLRAAAGHRPLPEPQRPGRDDRRDPELPWSVTRTSTRAEESAEELFEDAPCGYLTTLPDGTIVRVNRTFERWTGLDRRQLLGRRALPGSAVSGRAHLPRDPLRADAAHARSRPRDRGGDRLRRRLAPARPGQLPDAPTTRADSPRTSGRRSSTPPTGAATSRSCCARNGASMRSPANCSRACSRARYRRRPASPWTSACAPPIAASNWVATGTTRSGWPPTPPP